MFLSKVADGLDKQMLEFQNKEASSAQVNGCLKEIASINDGSTHVKGFKKKEGKKGSKRHKSWVECKLTKRKKNGGASTSQSQESTMATQGQPNPTWLNDILNQPSMESNNTFSEFGVTSFTGLLMAPHDTDTTTLANP